MKRIAVVGAGGFLGRTVIDEIGQRLDVAAIAVVRSPKSFPTLMNVANEVRFTYGSSSGLERALEGCDAVIDVSLGEVAGISGAATQLLSACQSTGIERLCYTSTYAVNAVKRSRLSPTKIPSEYGRQKFRAETQLLERAAATKIRIFRPGLIWGPRSSWTLKHFRSLVDGNIAAPAANAMKQSAPNLIFAPNLARLMIDSALSMESQTIVDCADLWWSSWEDYFVKMASATGLHHSQVHVATRLIRAGLAEELLELVFNNRFLTSVFQRGKAALPKTAIALLKLKFKPAPKPWQAVSASARSTTITTSQVHRDGAFSAMQRDIFVGWPPPTRNLVDEGLSELVGMCEALDMTAKWLRQAGYFQVTGLESAT